MKIMCEIIDRIGLWYGWFFWNIWKIFKKFFIQKSALFLGLEVIFWCMEWIWFILGLGIDIGGFVFCFEVFFELFSVLKSALKPSFYIVVKYAILSYQLKLIKMRAKSANPNDCAAPFLSPAVVNLRWYYYIILQ